MWVGCVSGWQELQNQAGFLFEVYQNLWMQKKNAMYNAGLATSVVCLQDKMYVSKKMVLQEGNLKTLVLCVRPQQGSTDTAV